ncbi:MAG: hypothetical protein FWD58_09955 [Firmicutes bacterium]|nr:hypothetical protein [Bacillota bacterium]
MLFKYLSSAFKHQKGYYILQIAAAAFITVALLVALSRSAVLEDAVNGYKRNAAGNADVLVTAEGGADRFFSLSDIEGDDKTMAAAEQILGYFKTYVSAGTEKTPVFCTLIVANYEKLCAFNPFTYIKSAPGVLSSGDVIISRGFAALSGITAGGRVVLTFGNLSADYTVAAIAENRGFFIGGTGGFQPIYMTPDAFRRIFSPPGLFSYNDGIVTDVFVRLHDAADAGKAVARIRNERGLNAKTLAVERNDVAILISVPLAVIAVCGAIFCILAFFALLYLLLLKESANFKAMRAVGMTGRRVLATECVIGLLATAAGFLCGVILSAGAVLIIRSSVFLLAGFKIGFLTYASVAAIALFVSLGSTCVAHAAVYGGSGAAKRAVTWAGCIVLAVPNLLYRISALRPPRSLRGALLKKHLKDGTVKSAGMLVLAGVFAFMLCFGTLRGLRASADSALNNSKFNVAVANIGANPDGFFEAIRAFPEAEEVFKARLYIDDYYFVGEKRVSAMILAAERAFIRRFTGFDENTTERFTQAKDACIVSKAHAVRHGLKPGSRVRAETNGQLREYTVFDVLDDDFYYGFYFIIALPDEEPPTHLLANADAAGGFGIDALIGAIYSVFPARNLAVADFDVLFAGFKEYLGLFMSIAFTFGGILAAFAAIVFFAVLAVIWRRSASEFSRFYNAGLSRARYNGALIANLLIVFAFHAGIAGIISLPFVL